MLGGVGAEKFWFTLSLGVLRPRNGGTLFNHGVGSGRWCGEGNGDGEGDEEGKESGEELHF